MRRMRRGSGERASVNSQKVAPLRSRPAEVSYWPE